MRIVSLAAAALLLFSCASTPAETAPLTEDPGSGTITPPPSSTSTPGGGDETCTRISDCVKGPPCTRASCDDGKCAYEPLVCETSDECADAVCDPTANTCTTTPKTDGTDCSLGECNAGKCEAIQTCFGDSPQQFLHCDGATAWYRDTSTDLYPASRLQTYACATGEIASEVALEFDPPPGTVVTASLQVTGGPDADLDLIILENDCLKKAACANPTVAGGAIAGITPGTGTESVTFTAQAGKKYYVVVDGKVASPVSFHVEVACQ